ncbi:sugar ABC transporter permease [Caldibacillus lycopersici]|uniref:Sugar ABC transporter permease n=1 Tax=Perspicuibacillus lycopersici TaxID=1325689 RepID=A0AAE3ISJ5_9BACI|nr:sugar ABC transporter permease [Perspicuibacillus lycopersici]MCU9612636.1 sugar ABC transporter permease [Perspicuibacillus lycopersici]
MSKGKMLNKKGQGSKGFSLSLSQQRAGLGYLFISPFLIGFILLFITPLFQSLLYSFSNLNVTSTGYTLDFVGLTNYNQVLRVDPNFIPSLITTILQMVTKVPIIIIFSFFAASLLNQKFKGRGFARSIFFLPVILTSGIILSMETSDLLLSSAQQVAEEELTAGAMGSGLQFLQFRQLLFSINMPPMFINFIVLAVDQIYEIVIASGVQILIFLAGLQSIPLSLYEASTMDGATAWENFWKITFPMVSPLIIVNSVYTVINTFTSPDNEMMSMIQSTIFSQSKFGFGSAMAWIYFLAIAIILAIMSAILLKLVAKYQQ